jgi:hypothetical protein
LSVSQAGSGQGQENCGSCPGESGLHTSPPSLVCSVTVYTEFRSL